MAEPVVVDATLDSIVSSILQKPPEKAAKPGPTPPVAEKTESPRKVPEGDDDVDVELPDDEELPDETTEEEEVDEGDPDEQLVEVVIDGETKQVALKDLKSSYSGTKFIDKRIQQASEAKNKAEKEYESLSVANKATFDRLTQLDAVLEQFGDQSIDWADLKAKDPLQYAIRREEVREVEDKRKVVQGEIDKIKRQQSLLEQSQFQKYLTDEAGKLVVKLPDFGNPKKAAATMDKFVKAGAEHYGYSEQELRKVSDHRVFVVLNDAVKYRELLARRKEAQAVQPDQKSSPKKVLRAGSTSRRTFSFDKKKGEAIINKAKSSGKPDDVAMTLLVGKK